MSDSIQSDTRDRSMPLLVLLLCGTLAAGGAYVGFQFVKNGQIALPFPALSPQQGSDSVVYVPLSPLIISMGGNGQARHLRFVAQLEVARGSERAVQHILPRIMDVLNGYLRAVEVADIENPASLVRLRAQMLRRVQIVVGAGKVRDLLVMEFVLS